VAADYEQPELRLLVSLCRELGRACGDGAFYLSARRAGQLVGVNRVKASRWLCGLRRDGILRLVSEGRQKDPRASRCRNVGE